ncbi:MAG: hypothetical protein OZSIB_0214 [Candidatus Ozemobacter sibiricus]|uniref:Carboxypeptidase regulatory-like domain-containing protein n=1 Tax=Candidatus Ozemobacter sibiricus TaxID=2268124 RepID=A0A367ZMJ8_9BACT|nr:MAG: hypothetical protein OZSIB_0214 [Candidatus Ozemobacter sibiricus]
MPRKWFTLCTLLALVMGVVAFTGCGGGGGGGGGITGPTNPGTNEGATTGNGVLTGVVTNGEIAGSLRLSVLAEVSDPAANVEVEAGDYDSTGEFVSFNKKATTNAKGEYRLEGLPTDRKNIIIRARIPGETEPFEGVVPYIPTDGIATAPIIDKNTKFQAKLVKFAEKIDQTFELNVGEVISKIPPKTLAQLSENEIKGIAEAFVNREKAQLKTFRNAGLPDDKFTEFRKFAFTLQREINDGILKGLYSPNEGWKLFDDQLRLRAKSMGLPPDVLLALQDVDRTLVGQTLPQVVTNAEVKNQFQRQFEFKNTIERIEAVVAALKVFVPTYVTQATYDTIAKGVERLTLALQSAPDRNAIEQILQADPVHGLIKEAIKKLYVDLKLFEGNPPRFTQLYPTPAETAQIKSTAGYAPDLADLTITGALRTQTTPSAAPPTPDQIAAFHQQFRDLIIKKIQAVLTALSADQAKALFVLLMQGPDLGLFVPPAQVQQAGGLPTTIDNAQLMGIIKAVGDDKFIDPPPGFPPAPAEWGHLAKVHPDSQLNGAPVPESTVPTVYTGVFTAPPTPTTPPTFKITGVQANVPVPTPQGQHFVGPLAKKDSAAGVTFWIGANTPAECQFLPPNDQVKNAMLGFVGQIVDIEGTIEAKDPTTGAPKQVRVITIKVAEKVGFVPPGFVPPENPVAPPPVEVPLDAIDFAKEVVFFNKYPESVDPQNKFAIRWNEPNSTTAREALVKFDPATLNKFPGFALGYIMLDHVGHTVQAAGLYSPSKNVIFLTKLLDTFWGDNPPPRTVQPPQPPTGEIVEKVGLLQSIQPNVILRETKPDNTTQDWILEAPAGAAIPLAELLRPWVGWKLKNGGQPKPQTTNTFILLDLKEASSPITGQVTKTGTLSKDIPTSRWMLQVDKNETLVIEPTPQYNTVLGTFIGKAITVTGKFFTDASNVGHLYAEVVKGEGDTTIPPAQMLILRAYPIPGGLAKTDAGFFLIHPRAPTPTGDQMILFNPDTHWMDIRLIQVAPTLQTQLQALVNKYTTTMAPVEIKGFYGPDVPETEGTTTKLRKQFVPVEVKEFSPPSSTP